MKQLIKAAAPGLYDKVSDARQRVRDRLFTSTHSLALPSGLQVQIRGFADQCMYDAVFVEGAYDRAIELALGRSDEAPIVIDLGANVGYFGFRFADRWLTSHGQADFRIVSFEGSPDNHAELERRLAQPLLKGRCQAHLGLVGHRSGHAHISSEAYHFKRAIVDPSSRAAILVPFLDIEQFVPSNRRIRLLKSNIEGAEDPLIREYGDLFRRVDVAVIQFHHDKCDVDELMGMLADAGLALVSIRQRPVDNQSYRVFANRLFVPSP